MNMTQEAKQWHQVYEDLPLFERNIIDAAYEEVRRVLSYNDLFKADNLDRSEEMVAAITKFYKECQR